MQPCNRLMCLFIDTLPIESALRVWDIFFVEGSATLFRIALALLHLHTDEILALDNTGAIFMCLSQLGVKVTQTNPTLFYPAAF
jgi:hypothetical protein